MTPVRARAAVVLIAAAIASIAAQSRTARTVRFASAALGAQATAAILLPPGYDASTRRYPVLYLLHGGTQTHAAFPSRSWFISEASRHAMIVVMPHIQAVYFSSRGGAPPAFESFIAKDLVGYVPASRWAVSARQLSASSTTMHSAPSVRSAPR